MKSEVSIGSAVKVEMLRVLYKHSSSAIIVSVLNASLVVGLLWQEQEQKVLLAWYISIIFTVSVRLSLFLLFNRANPQGDEVLAWELPYFFTLVLSSLVWGVGAVLIIPSGSFFHGLIVASFIVGMTGGAIAVYGAHYAMTLSTIIFMLVPIIVWIGQQGNYYSTLYVLGVIIFFISSIRAAGLMSNTLKQNLTLSKDLNEAKEKAEKLARIDELTGLDNRRSFYEKIEQVFALGQRMDLEAVLILIDLDHFKLINDNYGHAAGDEVLIAFSGLLGEKIRESDILARIGGEEFCLLLTATPFESALLKIEELRVDTERLFVMLKGQSLSVTASFGVAKFTTDIDQTMHNADEALYRAKELGRNRVEVYD
jgi:diguanylate cyclase